jgi:hypothetical protein
MGTVTATGKFDDRFSSDPLEMLARLTDASRTNRWRFHNPQMHREVFLCDLSSSAFRNDRDVLGQVEPFSLVTSLDPIWFFWLVHRNALMDVRQIERQLSAAVAFLLP